MIKIAIVEDSVRDAEQLKAFVNRWKDEKEAIVDVDVFKCALDYMENIKNAYDIVFLDIMLPDKNGVYIAKAIRKVDTVAIIVFTTNMAQYAINGYEVDAIDFILKPIAYARFAMLMNKCRARIEAMSGKHIVCRIPGSTYCLNVSDICYVEVRGHNILIYLLNNKVIEQRSTLYEIEQLLPMDRFARCSVSYLVNLQYVDRINGDFVMVNGMSLKMTRSKNKTFREKLVNYHSR